jgi:hypothetical protein
MHKVSILWSYTSILCKTICLRKCGGNYNTTTCTKTSNTPAKCALCGGNHPASYKGCEVYKDLQQNRGKSFNQMTHRPIQPKINVHDINQFPLISPNQTLTQMPFAPQTSYSQVLKQNRQPSSILDKPISPILDQLSTFLRVQDYV